MYINSHLLKALYNMSFVTYAHGSIRNVIDTYMIWMSEYFIHKSNASV